MKQIYAFLFAFIATSSCLFAQLDMSLIGTYETGIFDDGACEISSFDPVSQRLFVVNGSEKTMDILDLSTPATPTLITQVDITAYGGNLNSLAVQGMYVAVAVEDTVKQNNGKVVFFDTTGAYVGMVDAGPLPDMLAFSPDGNWLLVANEGEPDDDYIVDPEGSITVIDISGGIASVTAGDVSTADFIAYNTATLDSSIRIFGDSGASTVAQDLEPEYIVFNPDSKTAYVACQENNALAVVDIATATVTGLVGLGFKDHSMAGNGIDASNDDGEINITTWPIYGMYQPDAIASFTAGGVPYIISANEGDARDYDGYSEEARVRDLVLDSIVFPDYAMLQEDSTLGRLKVTTANGDYDGDGEYEALYAYGARSFSIWDTLGNLVYDSGDDIEQRVATALPLNFNSTDNDNDSFDDRSDDKGPEPEGVVTADILGRQFAFIGLERVGGIMVYEITNPAAPTFVEYENNRDFSYDADTSLAGDLAPEGLLFIPATESPSGNPLLIVSNEVSGTISVWDISVGFTGRNGETLDAAFRTFPNPSNGWVRFNKAADVQVLDINGRVLKESSQAFEMDLSGLPNGLYMIRTASGEVSRILIQH